MEIRGRVWNRELANSQLSEAVGGGGRERGSPVEQVT